MSELISTQIQSAIDIGCGVGTWLSTLNKAGVNEILGVDGPWVNKDKLVIPPECFKEHNFSETVNVGLDKKYDLAICLEVAEHIDGKDAGGFVKQLTSLSDVVLFSAAIPGQGGQGHINEQWPAYWAELFRANGHIVKDVIRARVWDDNCIPFWYRQNALLFGLPEKMAAIDEPELGVLPLVHPSLLSSYTNIYVAGAAQLLFDTLVKSLKRKLNIEAYPRVNG